ncbi:Rieske 2Fe-2S domain-containing protein [Acinetobacter sp. ANC 4945]|uniref:(2Fe-2S)-binding protein n=1 Tax=Acinetobacter amyesii TaxID=2942470 RepID=A0A1T1GY91_9GAMM|nr:Rieske 2Fe-2S domain-containing protein [Acinetobacter amyesii]MCL6246544.1 Rieske 2Fe-2S domain-containing protein [Acinetobacter amyesii]OOV82505.1 (2Fe-2S)-binding protein [Acinetobacter amyesii]
MSLHFEVPQDKIPSVGQRSFLKIGEQAFLLFNVDHHLYVIEDQCPHQGASFFSGKLDGCTIQCPAHGLRFNLTDGCMVNSALLKLKTCAVEHKDERVYIVLDSEVQA